jgi:hypothetical protein
MKILYLTTAIAEKDYTRLLNEGYALPNPSNQNFHDKLIQALALTDEVKVISFVPASCQAAPLKDDGLFHYVNSKGQMRDRLGAKKHAGVVLGKKLAKDGVDLILFDALNRSCGNVAVALAKKKKIPAVAILTDNPKNLAKVPYFYLKAFEKHLKASTASLALSSGLLTAVGMAKKPHFLFAGLVEEPKSDHRLFPEGSYLYFGGALLARYGVLNLIEAYNETAPDYDLVLAGHEKPSDQFQELIAKNPRIHFLGQVSKRENYDLESHAALLVNPRPYDAKLDQESIPSKLLEYLATPTPILSTIHTALQKEFPSDVNWLSDSSFAGIKAFFLAHLDSQKKWTGLVENHAQRKVLDHYGLAPIGKAVHAFLQDLKTSTN